MRQVLKVGHPGLGPVFPTTFAGCAGAHTLGRAYPHRSGFGKESTKYTKDGPGTPNGTKGGSSWTVCALPQHVVVTAMLLLHITVCRCCACSTMDGSMQCTALHTV